GRSSNVFLRNGARLYLDVGSHPEYATPECDNITDLVIHDKAGERILEGLLVDADRRLREEGIAGDIYLFKNNTDSAGNSYGCHENYLVGRHGEFGRLADILIPFLVTRQVICGAGKVLQTPRGAVYCVSQRAEHIWESVSSATTRSRPIINTRDEPHADAERFRRLHMIAREIDWMTTYQRIERYRARHALPLSSPRVAQLDLAYHDVHRGRGLYYLLQRAGAVERAARDIDIFEAKSVPPQTTRAKLRGEFIRRAQEKRRDFTVDWVHLKLNDQAQRTVLCKDPFRSVDERVEKLIASM